jgi:hypothetical protein
VSLLLFGPGCSAEAHEDACRLRLVSGRSSHSLSMLSAFLLTDARQDRQSPDSNFQIGAIVSGISADSAQPNYLTLSNLRWPDILCALFAFDVWTGKSSGLNATGWLTGSCTLTKTLRTSSWKK